MVAWRHKHGHICNFTEFRGINWNANWQCWFERRVMSKAHIYRHACFIYVWMMIGCGIWAVFDHSTQLYTHWHTPLIVVEHVNILNTPFTHSRFYYKWGNLLWGGMRENMWGTNCFFHNFALNFCNHLRALLLKGVLINNFICIYLICILCAMCHVNRSYLFKKMYIYRM